MLFDVCCLVFVLFVVVGVLLVVHGLSCVVLLVVCRLLVFVRNASCAFVVYCLVCLLFGCY